MIDLPDGRRWVRWDEDVPAACPECGRAWPDHPGVIEIGVVGGYVGRVLPECL